MFILFRNAQEIIWEVVMRRKEGTSNDFLAHGLINYSGQVMAIGAKIGVEDVSLLPLCPPQRSK